MISSRNPDKVPKIVAALGLKIHPRELKTKDPRQLLSVIFSQWLSLSTCIIQAIIDVVPPPSIAQRTRIPKMLYPDHHEATITAKNKVEEDLFSCNASPASSVIAYVSKMFAVSNKELPENKRQTLSADDMRRRAQEARDARLQARAKPDTTAQPPSEDTAATHTDSMPEPSSIVDDESNLDGETVLGFARIYSGVLRVGQEIYAILPKYKNERGASNPSNAKYKLKATVQGLYTMMGRELVPVESVQAGNVFAIRGLGGLVWRNATLCAPNANGLEEEQAIDTRFDYLINLGALHNAVS
jgi:ribosome assembly protein 1